MRILFIAAFFVFASISLFGQTYLAPAPDAMGLAKESNTPVNYYSGTPIINIPLAIIPSRALNVPISLSYNASGFKVQEIAGSVGLGWNLSAGGMITRITRGNPDDLQNGWCNSSSNEEPDMFIYNFLGHTGRFMVKSYNNIVHIPYRKMIISPGVCGAIENVWEIVDHNGIHYKFGQTEASREVTTLTPKTGPDRVYVSSWYLTEVSNAEGTDVVQFTYVNGSVSSTNYFFLRTKDPCTDDVRSDLTSQIAIRTVYINSIITASGVAAFTYADGRKDTPLAKRLSSLSISNIDGKLVMKYRFAQDYFRAEGCSDQDCYRLKLVSIQDLAPDPIYSFYYNDKTADDNLPSRYSKNFDHWGFYNDNTVDSWLPFVDNRYISGSAPLNFSLPGAQRDASSTKSDANVIKRIVDRYGASQAFEFESHVVAEGEQNVVVGGCRIKSIITTNDDGQSVMRQFTYGTASNPSLSSGILFRQPRYAIVEGPDMYKIQSLPHNGILDENGVHVGYSRVEERTSGYGIRVLTYTNYDLFPDHFDNDTKVITDLSFARGLLLRDEIFMDDGTPLTAVSARYNFETAGMPPSPEKNYIQWNQSIPWQYSCSCGFLCMNERDVTFNYKKKSISFPVLITRQISETFDKANSARKRMIVQRYAYDLNWMHPIKITEYDSAMTFQKYIKRFKYVTNADYWPASITGSKDEMGLAIEGMVNMNRTNVVVEQIDETQNSAGSYVLASTLTKFAIEGTNARHANPRSTWRMTTKVPVGLFQESGVAESGEFVSDERMQLTQSYDNYNQNSGKLERTTLASGVSTSYTWDSRNLSIVSTTSSGGVTTLSTSSTLIPMIGITSTTDANGFKTKQEYDVYGRPSMKRDHHNNILSRTRYHYKGETPGFVINGVKEQLIGVELTFSIDDIAVSIGKQPYFLWDFGDGTVIDNDSREVKHTYTTPGFYHVKVTALQTVYGPVTRVKNVAIRVEMTATMCANGPLFIDLCGDDATVYGECTTSQNTTLSPLILTINPTNGCASTYTYFWEYKNSLSSTWLALGSTKTTGTFDHQGAEGTFQIRCTITDACGNSKQYSRSIQLYRSTDGCPTNIK